MEIGQRNLRRVLSGLDGGELTTEPVKGAPDPFLTFQLNRLLAFRERVEQNQSSLRGEIPSAEEKKEQAAREEAVATEVHKEA